MIRQNEIVPTTLEHSLLASRILAGLNELQTRQRTPLSDAALNDAVGFFEAILEGSVYTRNREVAERSYDCALAFGEAINAIDRLPVEADAKSEPVKVVELLCKTARELRDRPTERTQDLTILVTFFRILRDVALLSDPQPYELVSYGE